MPQVVKHVVKGEKWACSTPEAGKNKPIFIGKFLYGDVALGSEQYMFKCRRIVLNIVPNNVLDIVPIMWYTVFVKLYLEEYPCIK